MTENTTGQVNFVVKHFPIQTFEIKIQTVITQHHLIRYAKVTFLRMSLFLNLGRL